MNGGEEREKRGRIERLSTLLKRIVSNRFQFWLIESNHRVYHSGPDLMWPSMAIGGWHVVDNDSVDEKQPPGLKVSSRKKVQTRNLRRHGII